MERKHRKFYLESYLENGIIVEDICKICKGKFHKWVGKAKRIKLGSVKSRRAVTCSKECSIKNAYREYDNK